MAAMLTTQRGCQPERWLQQMDEVTTSEAIRVSDLFVQIMYKTLSQNLISELTDQTVSFPQIHAMRYIWLHKNVLMGDLAEGLAISYPSATNMVKRLEKQGLVERVINPSDRREVQVKLTKRGVELTEQMEQERIARLQRFLSCMEESDRQALLHGLHRFIQAAVHEKQDIALDICLRCGSQASNKCPIAQTHAMVNCL
jgi:DNA-binding MarR family transcriptional regulator